jgi:hypothetical protein
VQAQRLAGRAKVRECSDRVSADEDAARRPPERNLSPPAVLQDRKEVEGCAFYPLGHDVVGDAEPSCKGGAVAVVPVEELDHAARLGERARPLLGVSPSDRIDEPDASVDEQRVRRPPHRLVVDDPAEPELLLVAEAHQRRSTRRRSGRAYQNHANAKAIAAVIATGRSSISSRSRSSSLFAPGTPRSYGASRSTIHAPPSRR